MKRLSTALAATALLALAACGGRTANNSAVNATANDVYEVAPDSMTANDLGNDSGNAMSSGNGSSSSNSMSGSGNSSTGNSHASSGNSASSHMSGNSH